MSKTNTFGSALALGALCLGAGYVGLVLMIGAGMFMSYLGLGAGTLATISAGALICARITRKMPALWLVWSLLFGAPMFTFGMMAGFDPPDPSAELLWRSIAVLFVVVPAIASYYERIKRRGPSSTPNLPSQHGQ
jgi:hypothetical protein